MDDCFNLVTLVGKNADGDELFSVDATELFNITAKYRSVDMVTSDAGLDVSVTEYADRSVAIDFVTNISGKAGNTLQLLTDEGSAGLYVAASSGTVVEGLRVVALTADYAVTSSDVDSEGYSSTLFVCTSETDITLTMPAYTDITKSVNVMQYGAGKVSIAGASGVTINQPSVFEAKTREQFSTITVACTADNTFTLMGDLYYDDGTTTALPNSNPTIIEVTERTSLSETLMAGNVILVMTSEDELTFTIPSGITGVNPVTVIQGGAGTITVVAGIGTTVKSYGNKLTTIGQEAWFTIVPFGSDVYRLSGALE